MQSWKWNRRTGLWIRKSSLPADVKRILIVAPSTLCSRQQNELLEKFSISFEIFIRERCKLQTHPPGMATGMAKRHPAPFQRFCNKQLATAILLCLYSPSRFSSAGRFLEEAVFCQVAGTLHPSHARQSAESHVGNCEAGRPECTNTPNRKNLQVPSSRWRVNNTRKYPVTISA